MIHRDMRHICSDGCWFESNRGSPDQRKRSRIERGMMGQAIAIGYRELPDGARVVVPAAQRKE